MKNNQGITLISLIITIIILIILASTAIYSGVSTINSSKLTAFETELKIMQSEVNDLYDKYRNGETVLVDSVETNILDLGDPAVGADADVNVAAKASITLTGAEVADDATIRENYRYFTSEYIKKLGIEGVTQDFLINVKSRKVVSYQGFSYQGVRYYTLEQITNRINNVEYIENENSPTFETSITQLENGKWKISIKNIQYEGYVGKWQVKYQEETWEYWAESDSLEFIVNETGYYNIYITNQNISSSEEIVAVGVAEPEPVSSNQTTLSTMLYGVIEVEFLDGTSYRTVSNANAPILRDGMEQVYWGDSNGNINTDDPQSNTTEVTSSSENYKKANWYKYVAQKSDSDGKTSRWANAITSEGSYYVWIPRYSYRIIYFDTPDHENAYREGTITEEEALAKNYIVGYSDARGIVDSEGKRPTDVTSTTAISVNDKYFRTHPVFDGNADEGGWDSKLTGIWVMKYEASRNDATESAVGSGTTPKSVPNVKAWVNTNVSTMFELARDAYNKDGQLNTILNSHMMKNSEWGAVAYLTESKYGRNGTEISVNQCSNYMTGMGRGLNSTEDSSKTGTSTIYNTSYTYSSITEKQKYAGKVGQLSSTTGNIYGIYDISGGSCEYVMGFYQEENGNIHIGNSASYGSGFNGYLNDGTKKTDGIEFPTDKKYYQLYKNSSNSSSNAYGGMLGDATKETKGWNSDISAFVYSDYPVFGRGGEYFFPDFAGSFYFSIYYGTASSASSFRVCLAVK